MATKTSSGNTQTQYRSSQSGEFVKKSEAERSPATHEKERIKHPAPPPPKKR